MPLRRTERSNGRKRPGWKDGSHACVKNSTAKRSPSTGPDSIVRFPTESSTAFASLPRCERGRPSFTRGSRAHAGADARIEGSEVHGQVRLAILPYGRRFKRDLGRFARLRTSDHDKSRGSEADMDPRAFRGTLAAIKKIGKGWSPVLVGE